MVSGARRSRFRSPPANAMRRCVQRIDLRLARLGEQALLPRSDRPRRCARRAAARRTRVARSRGRGRRWSTCGLSRVRVGISQSRSTMLAVRTSASPVRVPRARARRGTRRRARRSPSPASRRCRSRAGAAASAARGAWRRDRDRRRGSRADSVAACGVLSRCASAPAPPPRGASSASGKASDSVVSDRRNRTPSDNAAAMRTASSSPLAAMISRASRGCSGYLRNSASFAAELLEQRERGVQTLGRRALEEIERARIAAPGDDVEHRARRDRRDESPARDAAQHVARIPQSRRAARRGASRAAGALIGGVERDALGDEMIDRRSPGRSASLSAARVDDLGDPLDRQRGLGDVRREDHAATRRRRERALLRVDVELPVQRQDERVDRRRSRGAPARSRARRGGSRGRRRCVSRSRLRDR